MTKNEMTGKSTTEREINSGTTGRFIGHLVGANCFSGISQAAARAAADRWGIAGDLGWPRLKLNNYYRRAVMTAVSQGRRDERRFEAVKVEDNSARIVHAIVRRDLVPGLLGSGAVVADPKTGELRIASKDAQFQEEFKVQFDKVAYNKGWRADDLVVYEDRAKAHPVAAAIGAAYSSEQGVFSAEDLRKAFSRAFRKWDAIPILDHAGMWFIPATQEDNVRRWYGWMQEIGCRPAALRQRAGEDAMSDESIANSSSAGITNALAKLEKELDEFAASDTTRFSTLEERVGRFAELRRQTALHDELLGIRREKLSARLAEAQARWLGKLIEIAEAEAEVEDDEPEPEDKDAAVVNDAVDAPIAI